MKELSKILVLVLLTISSCTSSLYTGAEYDDLYFSASDQPIVKAKTSVNDQIAKGNIKTDDYYNNIYAADTLVSDQYLDAIDSGKEIIINNNNYSGGYDPYYDYSYTGRLRRFYGNYFEPYWRDPFYSGYGYSPFGYSFGFGGFPYSYNPYSMDPYYGYGGYYGDYYGGYYPGYYGGLGYYGGFGGYYGGYYGGFGGYNGYYLQNEGNNSIPYIRRERPSNLSSKLTRNDNSLGSSSRVPYLSSGGNSGVGRRVGTEEQTISANQRRAYSSNANSQQANIPSNRTLSQDQAKGENTGTGTASRRSSANIRPEYNSVNRSYTPSYSNPRMNTRPSYNNSRVSDGANSGFNRDRSDMSNSRVYNNAGSVRTPSNQNSFQNQGNSVQRRAVSPSNSSIQYSVPARRNSESSSGYSSGSYNNSSSGSRSSSSFSSGSSSSGSGGSYSSGSSSSGSSSSGSSSGSSSRRR